jgi:glycosyltransferase involved in cell wall biosynthesis
MTGALRVTFLAEPGDARDLAALAARVSDGTEVVASIDGTAPDLAVATGRHSAARLAGFPDARHAVLMMDMEDRSLPAGGAEAAAAAAVLTLPLAVLVPARWMAEQLAQLRDSAAPAVRVVRPGLDHAVFAAPPERDDRRRLRVLVLGTEGAELDAALSAANAMREPALVRHLEPAAVAPEQRAEAYAEADVVLSLAHVAGLLRAPLEAFACGATAVATPVTGLDEYLVDGRNGLLAAWDDERGTSRRLDLLARDRDLLHRLRTAAWETARAWPSTRDATAGLVAALREVAA